MNQEVRLALRQLLEELLVLLDGEDQQAPIIVLPPSATESAEEPSES